MGYAHGLCSLAGPNPPGWRLALERTALDLWNLLPTLPPLAGPDGQGEPVIRPQGIALNGAGADWYESLALEPEFPDYGFGCKTGFCPQSARPYDLAVRVTLLLARYHAGPVVKLHSDGNLAAWQEAAKHIYDFLGYPVDPYALLGRTVFRLSLRLGGILYYESEKNCLEAEDFMYLDRAIERLKMGKLCYLAEEIGRLPPYAVPIEPGSWVWESGPNA